MLQSAKAEGKAFSLPELHPASFHTMTLDLQQVARAMQAAGDVPAIPVAGWSVDTRTQNIGDVYFALRGPNHDGHEYLAMARDKGAAAVVVDKSTGQAG